MSAGPVGTPAPGRRDVLIVEDHFLSADALRLMFEVSGYGVRIALTAEEAVVACATQRPDLMLLDLTLPDGTGLDVLARTNAAGTTPRVVAALTGHDSDAVVQSCLEAGCVGVVLKPIAPRELVRRAGEWLA